MSVATFIIPADVAAHARKVGEAMAKTAQRLERLHAIYGDGECDKDMGDGEIWEWTVDLDHSEVERMIANLRRVAEWSEWLAKFGAPAAGPEIINLEK
jgi:hypothetical protein